MKMRMMLAAATVALLCSCGGSNDRDRGRDRDRDRSERSDRDSDRGSTNSSSSTTSTATTSTNGGGGGGQLEQQIAQAVQLIRPQLPIQQNGVTIDDIQARGTELVYHMKLPADIDENGFQRFRDALPTQACGNPQTRALLDQGGAFTYNVEDSGGEQFTATVRSCSN